MKIPVDDNAFVYPMPMTVVGTVVKGRPNFMAVGWVTRVNFKPPLIAVALGKSHLTNEGIHASPARSTRAGPATPHVRNPVRDIPARRG